MFHSPESRFTRHLDELGIPIDGVSGKGEACRIDFKTEATPAQRAAAIQAARAFDWSERELMRPLEIVQAVASLPTEKRTQIVNRMIAEYLVQNPIVALKVAEIDVLRKVT